MGRDTGNNTIHHCPETLPEYLPVRLSPFGDRTNEHYRYAAAYQYALNSIQANSRTEENRTKKIVASVPFLPYCYWKISLSVFSRLFGWNVIVIIRVGRLINGQSWVVFVLCDCG